MDEHLKANRELWDELTAIHAASEYYDVDGFKAGRCTLWPVEIEEVGDVAGKSLLHLQCHFGMDTLSWARLGANVTGVDFSSKAIELARSLAAEVGIAAEFVCCNIYDLPEHLDGEFDIVFTSEGAMAWLPDLTRWAEVIAHFLRPGGVFYIFEFHPIAGVFDDSWEVAEPRLRYPYFHSDEPIVFEPSGSYADPDAGVHARSCEWSHSMADIVNGLIGAGLRIEFLHEFPFTTFHSHPFVARGADGLWRYEAGPDQLPLMFSIRAVKQ